MDHDFTSLKRKSRQPNPFKVGDKATVVDNSGFGYTHRMNLGESVTVTNISGEYVTVETDGGEEVAGLHARFEKYPESPFKVGDSVVCVRGNAWLKHGQTYIVTDTYKNKYPDATASDIFVDGGSVSQAADRFKLATVPDDVTGAASNNTHPVDALLSEYADRLERAVNNGTMTGRHSSLGLLSNFLVDYNNLNS